MDELVAAAVRAAWLGHPVGVFAWAEVGVLEAPETWPEMVSRTLEDGGRVLVVQDAS